MVVQAISTVVVNYDCAQTGYGSTLSVSFDLIHLKYSQRTGSRCVYKVIRTEDISDSMKFGVLRPVSATVRVGQNVPAFQQLRFW